MSSRREFTMSPEYAARFLSAIDEMSAATTSIRHLALWNEMAFVVGFDVGSVERSAPYRPTVFIAMPIETASQCVSEGVARCPDKPCTVIDGDMYCPHHAAWVREDNARIALEDAQATTARRAQLAYDRAVIARIEAEAKGEVRFQRSVRS